MNILKDQQLEFQKLARDFAKREIAPCAMAADREARIPEGLIAKIKELGLVNVGLPEEYGGMGLSTLDACVIAEELAAACSGIASATESSELALTPLLLDTGAGKAKELMTSIGQNLSLLGLSMDTETDINQGRLTAVPCNDGYSLHGNCQSVWNAGIADWIFVVARIESVVSPATPSPTPRRLVGLYVKTGVQGVETRPHSSSLGRRAANVAAMTFKDVFVEKAHAIETGDDPARFLDAIASRNNPIIAAGCVGVARSALEHAVRYALERQTFNQPIAHHQGVAFMLADMKKDVEAARLMTERAACIADAASSSEAKNLHVSCRAYAQEMAMNVTTDAVQVFGGYGYSKEYPVEKLMRDAKVYDLLGSTVLDLKGDLGRLLLTTEAAGP
jgi:acyl-CoA dehydrogenase